MTRRATAKPKAVTAYVVVREFFGETKTYTEPDRVFASRAAARRYADDLNAQLRALTNPFEGWSPDFAMTGGEKALIQLVRKLGLTPPAKQKGYAYIDWQAWWDRGYFDMTDAQRAAIWDALDKYNWYKVKATTVE